MAHVKQAGSKAHQGVNISGKRLGIKKGDGETVIVGNILVRQHGTVVHPGRNVGMGRDYTIFTNVDGTVRFRNMVGHKRGKKIVDVIPSKVES